MIQTSHSCPSILIDTIEAIDVHEEYSTGFGRTAREKSRVFEKMLVVLSESTRNLPPSEKTREDELAALHARHPPVEFWGNDRTHR